MLPFLFSLYKPYAKFLATIVKEVIYSQYLQTVSFGSSN